MSHPVVLDFERPVLELERRIRELEARDGADHAEELQKLRRKAEAARSRMLEDLTPFQRVQIARHPGRPRPCEVVDAVVEDFVELQGDRASGDDPGLLAGLGYLRRRRLAVLAHGRGRPRSGGGLWTAPPTAAGMRKAARVVELAARFGLPLVTLVDTAHDAAPDLLTEAALGPALTELQALLMDLPEPSLCVVLGEAYGDAGAALAVTDRVLVLEHAVCAPVSPETCAQDEFGDATRAADTAEALRLTAQDLRTLGFADAVVPEPPGGAHRDPAACREQLAATVHRDLQSLRSQPMQERLEARRARLQTLTQLIAVTR